MKTKVKILKAHLGLKADEVHELDTETADELIKKGIAEAVKVEESTVDTAMGELTKAIDEKLDKAAENITKQVEDRLTKSLRGMKRNLGVSVEVGTDGRLLDPTNGFKGLHDFAKCVRTAAMGGGEDERLVLIRKAPAGASEGTAADGGYAVPVQYAQSIFDDIIGQDSLFNSCFKVPMNTSSIKLPALNYVTQGSFGVAANWEGEGIIIPTSKPAYRQPSLSLNKLTVLVPVTSELLEDGIAVEPVITKLASEAMTYKINDAIINGTGTGQPVGIIGHAATVSVAKESAQTAATVVAANVLKMRSRLYGNRQRARWFINQDVEPALLQIQDPNGRYLYFAPGSFGENPNGRLLGLDVVPLINCQTLGTVGDIILWDPQSYVVGYRATGPQMAISIHLYFATDQTAYRWTFRMDGRPWRDATLAAANGSATYSGAVTLATRA